MAKNKEKAIEETPEIGVTSTPGVEAEVSKEVPTIEEVHIPEIKYYLLEEEELDIEFFKKVNPTISFKAVKNWDFLKSQKELKDHVCLVRYGSVISDYFIENFKTFIKRKVVGAIGKIYIGEKNSIIYRFAVAEIVDFKYMVIKAGENPFFETGFSMDNGIFKDLGNGSSKVVILHCACDDWHLKKK
jgi:hypothetical protein